MRKGFKLIGICSALLGLFLILVFMPFWCWVVITGLAFVLLGIIIIKMSC